MTRTDTYTPGPWRVRCEVDRGSDLTGTDEHFFIAAGAEDWHDNKGHFHPDDARYVIDEYQVVELGSDRDYNTPEGGIRNKADAYLIAAAPDLLEAVRAGGRYSDALKRYQDHGVSGGMIPGTDELEELFMDWHDKGHAAIAKAEGR